jgi:large subunit ribosomal protein L4
LKEKPQPVRKKQRELKHPLLQQARLQKLKEEAKVLKVDTYSAKGTRLGLTTLPKNFEEKVNLPLLAQAVRVYEEKVHIGLSKTKTRAEVNMTKKKVYKQKGTGGARHGAKSAPIFVGGGTAHGPKPIRREMSLPRKMAKKALGVALSLKAKDKEIIAVSGLSKFAKTKEAGELIEKLIKINPKIKRFTLVLGETEKGSLRALRNLKNVKTVSFRNLTAYDVYVSGMLVLDKDIFATKKETSKK